MGQHKRSTEEKIDIGKSHQNLPGFSVAFGIAGASEHQDYRKAFAALGLLIVPPLFAWFRMDPATIATLRGNAGGGAATTPHIPGFGEWVVSVVPTNPVKAASDGAMLPPSSYLLSLSLWHCSR
jgi:hypothetical protein